LSTRPFTRSSRRRSQATRSPPGAAHSHIDFTVCSVSRLSLTLLPGNESWQDGPDAGIRLEHRRTTVSPPRGNGRARDGTSCVAPCVARAVATAPRPVCRALGPFACPSLGRPVATALVAWRQVPAMPQIL
jgi:hypothetical protein